MGTSQSGVTSSLDWNLVANGLLRFVNGGGCYVEAYADDHAAVTGSSDLALQSTSCSAC